MEPQTQDARGIKCDSCEGYILPWQDMRIIEHKSGLLKLYLHLQCREQALAEGTLSIDPATGQFLWPDTLLHVTRRRNQNQTERTRPIPT